MSLPSQLHKIPLHCVHIIIWMHVDRTFEYSAHPYKIIVSETLLALWTLNSSVCIQFEIHKLILPRSFYVMVPLSHKTTKCVKSATTLYLAVKKKKRMLQRECFVSLSITLSTPLCHHFARFDLKNRTSAGCDNVNCSLFLLDVRNSLAAITKQWSK